MTETAEKARAPKEQRKPAASKASGLYAALLKAQAAFPAIEKTRTATIITKTGGSYGYNYADLEDILKAVRPVLNEHGIVLTQRPGVVWSDQGEANVVIETALHHAESGESIISEWPLAMQTHPQDTGKLVTYFRRYALCSLLGISAEEAESEESQESQPVANRPVKGKSRKPTNQVPTNTGKPRTALKSWLHEFVRDLHSVSDQEELVGLLNSERERIGQCQKDMPNWWYGDSRNPDYKAPAQLIERLQDELPPREGSPV